MPRGDGTGPIGPGSGRSAGRGTRRGRGRMGGPIAAGPGGRCVCPDCGYEEEHRVGYPCSRKSCPRCGTTMRRD